MRLRMLAVIGLIAVGLGAAGLAVFAPNLGGPTATQYLTSTAAVGTVTAQSVATGSIAASTVYGLSFGQQPTLASGSSSSTAQATGGGGSSSSWPVTRVSVAVGDHVTKGQVLAEADASAASLQVDAAEASLAAAESRLEADRAGPDAATKLVARDSIVQAKNQLAQATQSRADTLRQNAIAVRQAEAAVKRARQKLRDDRAAGAPDTQLAADETALDMAKESLASTRARVAASNNQAYAQVRSAQQAVTSARNQYATKVAPATAAQIASDEAAVANARTSLRTAQDALAGATLVAPVDGTITAVNVVPGTLAPSGAAIQVEADGKEVTASFAESDVTKLRVGQPATVSVTAAGASVAGTVARISPVASSSGGTSVVTYAVTVDLVDPPATVFTGMSASVAVTTAEVADVVTVPAIALSGSSGAYAVRVVGADGQATQRQVEIGLVTSSLAEIKNGIAAGESVVIGTVGQRTTTTTTGGAGLPIGGLGGGTRFPGGGPQP